MLNYALFRASFVSIFGYFASKISKNTEKSVYLEALDHSVTGLETPLTQEIAVLQSL